MDKPEVVILCGGRGSRLLEETETKPKPMVEIGGRPILWHIMKTYAHYGYTKFILALGYKGDYIKKYFYDFRNIACDFTLHMNPHQAPQIHNTHEENDWEITFVNTGVNTLKGGRIKRVEKYIKSDNFLLTYGDGVAQINITDLYKYHLSHKKIGTLTAVHPPSLFGEMVLSGNRIAKFIEKPQLQTGFINGGFFVFKIDFMDYVTADIECDFEFGPLQKLAKEDQFRAYKHEGFWQCMDNIRDRDYLNKLWDENKAAWKVWK